MIKINNDEYRNINTNISFGNYNVVQDGINKKGISPIIDFSFDNIHIRIETVLDKDIIMKMKNNDSIDITRKITDISFEDEKGWISLIIGSFKCNLNKISDDLYNIILECNCDVGLDCFNISLNENIKFC